MKNVGRLIAALLTVGFGALAIPFLALTTMHLLSGGGAGTATLLVYVAYAFGVVAFALLWIRSFAVRRRSSPTDRA